LKRTLVDTGPIVAILSRSDEHHALCVDQLRDISGRLLTCWPVITEAAWLLRNHSTAIGRLLAALDGRLFELASLDHPDLHPIGAILAKYKGLGLQLADAALVHLANREEIDTIFTLDRRDFGAVRLAHGKALRLIP